MIRELTRQSATHRATEVTFRAATGIFYWKIQHLALWLFFQNSQSTAHATRNGTSTSPSTAPATKSDTWASTSIVPATKSDTCASPSTAPATQNIFHVDPRYIWNVSYNARSNRCHRPTLACHEKWHLSFTKYCACHEKWHLSFTKYYACHEKWHLHFSKYCACHEK